MKPKTRLKKDTRLFNGTVITDTGFGLHIVNEFERMDELKRLQFAELILDSVRSPELHQKMRELGNRIGRQSDKMERGL